MEKRLAQIALGLSAITGGVFLLDMVAGIPYGQTMLLDVFGLIASALVFWMSFSTMREQQ
jgi:hypothetical protein